MSLDTVIIGAGLAGLTAALRLAEEGRRVLVLGTGLGATHLGGGTIDVLGYAPERVDSPARALPAFVASHPDHPYARLSAESIGASIEWLKSRLHDHRYVGGLDQNLLLATAVGVPKPSAVVPGTMAGGDLRPGGRFVYVGFRSLKDFYPAYLAENVARAATGLEGPVTARGVELDLTARGNADASTLAFARCTDDREFRKELIRELQPLVEPGERVGFPALLGLSDPVGVAEELQDALGCTVFEVPTLPPSVPGIRMFAALKEAISERGGRVVLGTAAAGGRAAGGRLEAVVTRAAARTTTYSARSFVLATGGFASRGLSMDSFGTIRETVLDLPLSGVPTSGEPRFLPRYFDPHPISRAGVAVDDELRPVGPDGRPVYENLHVAGATIAGAEPWREKSGNGISLATGYRAAAAILERTT